MKLALKWQLEASRLVVFQGDTIAVLQTFGALEARVLLYSMIHRHTSTLHCTLGIINSAGLL